MPATPQHGHQHLLPLASTGVPPPLGSLPEALSQLELVLQFPEGLHVGVTWSGYSEIAANRRIQHPKRQLQKPIRVDMIRTAVRHRDAALDQRGMYFHSATEPRMPRVPDISEFSNMGVVLMTCIMKIAFTTPWRRTRQTGGQ